MIWAKLTAQLVGRPYKAGAAGPHSFDCMGLLIRTQRKLGWKMPREFEGWTLANYAQRYEEDPEAGLEVLRRLLNTHCNPVDLHYLRRGDILLVKENVKGQVFPGIYAGKRTFLTVFRGAKVRIMNADSRLCTILEGWRHGS